MSKMKEINILEQDLKLLGEKHAREVHNMLKDTKISDEMKNNFIDNKYHDSLLVELWRLESEG